MIYWKNLVLVMTVALPISGIAGDIATLTREQKIAAIDSLRQYEISNATAASQKSREPKTSNSNIEDSGGLAPDSAFDFEDAANRPTKIITT